MSLIELAKAADLYDRNSIAIAASRWLAGPGASFLRLKRSEVSAIRRVIGECKTSESIHEVLATHLTLLTERRKGSSTWSRTGIDGKTMQQSLFCAMKAGADDPMAGDASDRAAWGRIKLRLDRTLNADEMKNFENHRRTMACFEFLDDLIRHHQASKTKKELTTLWRQPQVS